MAKWLIVALLLVHGLIHVMGVVKALGLAEMPQLTHPISRGWGVAWGVCAVLFVAVGIARIADAPWWWMVGALALPISQVTIVAFWSDAKFGTVANVLLVLPLVIAFGRWRFATQVESELARLGAPVAESPASVIVAEELSALPAPVARWLTKAAVVGRPRDRTVYLTQQGSMQKSPGSGWMPFRAEQWFTVAQPGFLWVVDVDSGFGLSLAGRDSYIDGAGAMRIDLLSLLPVVHASGAKITQGALLRFLAEAMWFPSAALAPYLQWEAVDATTARATLRNREVEASGLFRFDEHGDVIGFEAKRYREEALEDWIIENDPSAFEQRDGVRIPTRSTVTWRDAEGELWTWLRLEITALERNADILLRN